MTSRRIFAALALLCAIAVPAHADLWPTSATGSRYSITANGVVYTAGAGATYLPGNAAGSTGTGGQYI